jgi:hypothetical protein
LLPNDGLSRGSNGGRNHVRRAIANVPVQCTATGETPLHPKTIIAPAPRRVKALARSALGSHLRMDAGLPFIWARPTARREAAKNFADHNVHPRVTALLLWPATYALEIAQSSDDDTDGVRDGIERLTGMCKATLIVIAHPEAYAGSVARIFR